MSVVMVLQFGDDISVPGVQRLLHEALRNWPQLPVEMGYVAIDGDAQLVLDVFVPPELGGGRHVAVFSEDGEWVIEHSLVCRRSERMVACPYIKLVFSEVLQLDANGEGRPDAGKWRLEMGKDALDVPCLFMIWEGLMRVFYDTEFIERGPRYPIKLVSIGMVREDGVEYYAVNGDLRSSELRALHEDDWLRENVLAHLPCKTEPLEGLGFGLDDAHPDVKSMNRIALDVDAFCDVDLGEGEKAELWAYYADYDHVVLSQLFGRMVDLPAHMPMYTRDLKQFMDDVEVSHGPVNWKQQTGDEHHALADAKWVAKTYAGVEALSRMTVKP